MLAEIQVQGQGTVGRIDTHELWRRARGPFRELVQQDPQAAFDWLARVVQDAEDILAESAPEIDVGSGGVQQPDGSVGGTG